MPMMMKVQLVTKMLRKVLRLLDKVKIWLWLMRLIHMTNVRELVG